MLLEFIIGCILVVLFTPLLIYATKRLNLFDNPNTRRINLVPVPTAGGLAIFVAFFVAAYFFRVPNLLSYLAGALVITIIGLIDDYRGLTAGVKFFGQLAAVLLFMLLNPAENSFITAFWMLSAINMLNFIDGLDGLASGITLIAAVTVAVWTYSLGDLIAARMFLILAGTTLGFLLFNFHPAKIFLGDTGAMLLGFLFAALANNSVLQSNISFGLPVLVLILALPVLDTVCAVIRRFQQGVPFYQADKQHFHHRLLDLGLSQKQVALCGYLLTFAAAATALFLVRYDENVYVVLTVVAAVFMWGASKIGMVRSLVPKSQREVL